MFSHGKNIHRVLLIRRKALGDCLVTLPAIYEMVKALPDARIDLIIDRPFARLISLLVPDVNVIPCCGQFSEFAWYRHLRAQKYDLVVDWLGSPRTALWTMATGASLRVGYDLPRRRWAYNIRTPRNEHRTIGVRCFAGEAFLDPLRALGIQPASWNPGFLKGRKLSLPESDLGADYRLWRDSWAEIKKEKIAMMMSATWPAKAWANPEIIRLWFDLRDRGYSPLVVPGPGDETMMAVLREELPPEAFAPPTNLAELTDLFRLCRVFIGTDCGGRHLATALGLRTVTVFGPTDAQGWNPGHPWHVAVKSDVECLGCDLKKCPVPGHPCLDQLPASAVVAGLVRVLQDTTGGAGNA
jgi:ADP-heptose:LPS heptosyltransferase